MTVSEFRSLVTPDLHVHTNSSTCTALKTDVSYGAYYVFFWIPYLVISGAE